MPNLFQNPTKSIPMRKADSFVVRVPLNQIDIGGRVDHMPKADPNEATIRHVPNAN